jgi:dTDP-4-amino-4,6-dideoxygalactose transaminase
MKVPLVDLRCSLEPIQQQLMQEFEDILEGMQLFLGPRTRAFEAEFAAFCEVEHGVAVSNGTDALRAALTACEIGPGDEVIVPSLTFFATCEAVVHVGAIPVFVDVEPRTLTMDPEEVRRAVTPATRAILPVHLYGHPVDMDAILEIANRQDLVVIEDCAQAHGARYKERRCGSMGDTGCFSFYFTKNLGAFGEAGFVTTRDRERLERLQGLRNHGHVSKFEHGRIGFNMRMDELQAAVLRLKLPLLEANNERRRNIATLYDQLLDQAGVELLSPRPECVPVYHLYPIRTPYRDALRAHLEERGVGTGIHYKISCHEQPALRDIPHRVFGDLEVTRRAARELLSLPMYPELRRDQVDWVAQAVLEFSTPDQGHT